MARTINSRLIMEVIDRVTGPARAIARNLRTIDDRITANNVALDRARGRLFDAAAGFYTLKAALSAPINAGLELETALGKIASKANLSAETMNKLLAATRAASRQSNQATADLLKGVDYLVGMGLSAEDAAASIRDIGIATTATGGDIEQMSQAGYAAMANLKVPADQVAKALDAMAMAGKRGGFELKDMAQYLPASAAAYQALGQTGTDAVADLAAAMQVMRMDTGDASTAATNLQNVIQKTFAPGTVKKFADQGVDIFAEMEAAAKRGLTPLEAIAEITNKTLDGDLKRLGSLFEDAQAQAGIRSLIQHQKEYLAIREEAAKADGVNAADFDRAMKTGAQRIKRFKNAMADLAAVVGTALLPAVEALTAILVPLVDRFAVWAETHPKMAAGIISITSAVIGLRVAMAALSYAGLMGKGGLLAIIAPLARMVTHLKGAAVGSIALQAALGRMSGQSLTAFQKIGTGVRAIVMAVPGVGLFTQALTGLATAVAAISAPVWLTVAAVAAAVAAAGALIWKYWDRISAIMSGVGRALGEILSPALEKLRPVLDWFAPLGEVIAAGWQKAKDVLSAVGDWFSGFFTRETLSDDQKAAYEQSGYDLVMAFWDGMKSVFNDMIAWVQSKVDAVIAPFKNAAASVRGYFGVSQDAVPTGGGRSGGALPARAKGGRVSRGGTYLTGENGPELITASRSGYVHRNGAGGSGGSPTINLGGIHIAPSPGADAREIAREVWRQIEAKTREALRGINADTGLQTY